MGVDDLDAGKGGERLAHDGGVEQEQRPDPNRPQRDRVDALPPRRHALHAVRVAAAGVNERAGEVDAGGEGEDERWEGEGEEELRKGGEGDERGVEALPGEELDCLDGVHLRKGGGGVSKGRRSDGFGGRKKWEGQRRGRAAMGRGARGAAREGLEWAAAARTAMASLYAAKMRGHRT